MTYQGRIEIESYLAEARSQIERIFLSRPALLAPTLDHLRRGITLYANLCDRPVEMGAAIEEEGT